MGGGTGWEIIWWVMGRGSQRGRHLLYLCLTLSHPMQTQSQGSLDQRSSKTYKDENPYCVKCNQSPANRVRMFWGCLCRVGFWKDIFNTLWNKRHTDWSRTLHRAIWGFLAHITLLKWKSSPPPSHALWIKNILNFFKLEKLKKN